MTVRIDRRTLLAGAAGLASLASLGARGAWAQDTRVRLMWWGNTNRNERTAKVIELFTAANPGVGLEGESAGWDDYWTRLATQTAGGNAPDVMQMDYRYIFEYARRGVLLPLDDAIAAGTLDLSGFSEDAIAGGKVDGKTYGISLGANSSTMMVNRAAFEEAGVALPERGMTWDDYAARAAELTEKAGKRGFYGSSDGGGVEPTFECWLRQRGKALYDAEGKLGFDAGDATEWFAMWQGMRDSGACVPADLQALDQRTIETSMVTLGHAAVAFNHTNQIVGFQAVNETPLVMVPYPTGGADSSPDSIASRRCSSAPMPRPGYRSNLRRSSATSSMTQRLPRCSASSAVCRNRPRCAKRSRTRSTTSTRRRSSSSRTWATSPGRCHRPRRPVPARSSSR